jgi:TolB-like protein/DNA-binding winged helix-turn-helix (wHTH) protein/Tfp pilus assembly protein PilF
MLTSKTRFYEFGEFRLDAEERLLYKQGAPVTLTHKTFNLLLVLIESNGRVMERDELMKAVWPDTAVDPSSLKKAVSTLRRALSDEPENSSFIQTLPKRGYRFIAHVTPAAAQGRNADILIERYTTTEVVIEDEEIEDELADDAYPENDGSFKPLHSPRAAQAQLAQAKLSRTETLIAQIKQHPLGVLIALASIAASIVWFSAAYYHTNRDDSLAVMPFTYTAADASIMTEPDGEYLSDGLTENIIQSLSQVPGLKVIARSSVFRYKGKEIDPQMVGLELGVRKILTGRITKRGDTLTISVELIDAADRRELWGSRYEVKAADLLATQSEITTKISGQLRPRLTDADERRVARRYTENIEAYRLYLKGRYFWNKRTGDGIEKAIGYFKQAIDKDPRYALAYAGLAESYILLSTYTDTASDDATSEARQAAMKALELDEQLAEAHTVLAEVAVDYDADWAGAEREFKRSIEINPNDATTHQWFGLRLAQEGRFDEALTEVARARELDPVSMTINSAEATVFYYSRQYDQAITRFVKAIELSPDAGGLHLHLSDVYRQKGMYAEATTELQKATSSYYDAGIKARLGLIYAKSGNRGEALKIINELEQTKMSGMQYYIAGIYNLLGDKEQALAWLEKTFQQKDPHLNWVKVDTLFDSLHSDQRYAALLHRLRLAD